MHIPLKQQCLDNINSFTAEKYSLMDFTVSWKPIWEEILSLILLDESGKSGLIAAHSVSYTYTNSLITFLKRARPYLNSNGDDIMTTAMSLLSDPDKPAQYAQGITLLLTCLPTSYHDYDAAVPTWLKVWDQIENNSKWDAWCVSPSLLSLSCPSTSLHQTIYSPISPITPSLPPALVG